MADVAHAASAAKRRRERRLRATLRHGRRSVAMALAELTHHSSRGQRTPRAWEEVENATHDAPRRQKTPPPGEWPGSLFDPRPQRSDRSLRRSAGDGLPQLVTPSLANTASEAVDSATLAFLLSQSLAAKEREEQVKREEVHAEWRRRRRKLKEEFMALLDLPSRSPLQQKRMEELADMVDALEASRPGTSSTSSSALKKKKKKKRRKRMRTSSFPGTTSWCLVVG